MFSKSSRQCEMKARLHHFESLYHDLQYENAALRSELQRKGVDIVELLAQKKQPVVDANANTSQSSHESAAGPRSGVERSPGKLKVAVEGGGGGGSSAQPLLLPQVPSRPPKTLPPKKERDLIVEWVEGGGGGKSGGLPFPFFWRKKTKAALPPWMEQNFILDVCVCVCVCVWEWV